MQIEFFYLNLVLPFNTSHINISLADRPKLQRVLFLFCNTIAKYVL